jgi:hypothetical protein
VNNTYPVTIQFIFEGSVHVHANSPSQAAAIAAASFGLTIGPLHASDDRIIDWHFNTHPKKHTFPRNLKT